MRSSVDPPVTRPDLSFAFRILASPTLVTALRPVVQTLLDRSSTGSDCFVEFAEVREAGGELLVGRRSREFALEVRQGGPAQGAETPRRGGARAQDTSRQCAGRREAGKSLGRSRGGGSVGRSGSCRVPRPKASASSPPTSKRRTQHRRERWVPPEGHRTDPPSLFGGHRACPGGRLGTSRLHHDEGRSLAGPLDFCSNDELACRPVWTPIICTFLAHPWIARRQAVEVSCSITCLAGL